jgi:hypothetical protein
LKEGQRGDSFAAESRPEENAAIDRRAFVVAGGFLGLTALTGGFAWSAAPATPVAAADVEEFRVLSRLLTGAPELDPGLAERAYNQLTFLDAGFPGKTAALAAAVKSSGAASMDAFLASPNAGGEDLRGTMVTIVSAWYLGFTGTPIPLRAEDDTGFVTLTEARMYAPTIDATVRPSYARDGLNYWVEPPSFVVAPVAAPGIKSWGKDSPRGIGTIPDAGATAPAGEPPTPASPGSGP